MKKTLRITSILLLLFSVYLFVTGTQASGKTYTLTIASLEPIGAPTTLSVARMAALVAERSGGRLKINPNPAGALGTGLQIMEGVSVGTIDMISMVLEWYAPFVKDLNVYAMGFTYRDDTHFRKFVDSPLFAGMKDQVLEKMGVRILASNWIGLPRVLVSKKAVKTPADIANIKMRVPEIETYLKVWKGLGTSPTRVAWAEVYLALKTGTVDAAEGPLDQMYATKFYEAAPYITLTNHLQQVFTVSINDKIYKALPADLREILRNAAIESGEYFQKLIRENFEVNRTKMIAGGAIFSNIDTVPFQKMLVPVIKESEETGFWSKGLYQKVQDIK